MTSIIKFNYKLTMQTLLLVIGNWKAKVGNVKEENIVCLKSEVEGSFINFCLCNDFFIANCLQTTKTILPSMDITTSNWLYYWVKKRWRNSKIWHELPICSIHIKVNNKNRVSFHGMILSIYPPFEGTLRITLKLLVLLIEN